MKHLIGHSDLLFITLDTLRFDAAQAAFESDQLTTLGPYLGPHGWELRHSPASFTYAAHHAFFAGFLPTPPTPGPHTRRFAAAFSGSESTADATFIFPEATLPEALSARGYRSICIGGTGFFNRQNALGNVLPGLFDEAHWNESLGVTCPDSPQNQVKLAVERVAAAEDRRVFLFINASALHQPNWFFGGEERRDTLATHTAALCAFDRALAPLLEYLQRRGPCEAIICSDHGTAYGEDDFVGHRHAHPVVWNVPYAEFSL
ncbi:MAG: STM4013/SEN3800 family hydrolase [Polyangiaceae bacterium]